MVLCKGPANKLHFVYKNHLRRDNLATVMPLVIGEIIEKLKICSDLWHIIALIKPFCITF